MLNPYASQLGDLDPLEVIAATPAKLRALMDAIGGERAEQPRAPGKWSAREIVCHLADCEVGNRTPHPPACSRRAGGLSLVIPTRPAGVGAMVRRGPKGLSQFNVRQNATVCIRGEPLSAGSPAGRDFSAAARNSSQVLAHSRVTLLFFRPRLGEMLQDAGQPQHGGRAGRVLRPGPRLAIGTTRFCAAQHV